MKHRPYLYLLLTAIACIFAIGCNLYNGQTGRQDFSTQNLLLNASLEDALSETLPLFWRPEGEGERDAVFRYPVEGYQGGNAIYVEMANRQTGDAKWMPYDVAVVPGETYRFTAMYRSNAASKIAVRYNRGTCLTEGVDCNYAELGVQPASERWAKAEVSLTVPAGVRSLTIFQLLDQDGWLYLDELALTPSNPAIATIEPQIPNPTFTSGLADANTPSGWLKSGQGKHQPLYTYINNDGVDDRSSIKVTVTQHEAGSAEWMYTPQAIAGGQAYLFSVAYKTDIVPDAGVQLIDGAGKISFLRLPKPEPQGEGWQRYAHEFFVPKGTLFASAFLAAPTNGYIQTDDYRLEPFTYQGFDRPIVTLTFDDGYEENIATALLIMEQYGFNATHCYTTGNLQNNSAKIQSIKTLQQAGHEICSHSVTHAALTKLNGDALMQELEASQATLEDIVGAPIPNFVTPYGAYDPAVKDSIQKF